MFRHALKSGTRWYTNYTASFLSSKVICKALLPKASIYVIKQMVRTNFRNIPKCFGKFRAIILREND